jgi:hypothetical protein
MILLIQKLNVEKYLGIVYKILFTHGFGFATRRQ